ncbi:vacuolar protein sorting-associated protein 13A-like isoform X3 [Pecten maximus]|uniref:vacuolar protein sorting-associated protein 13A-like isoform X3 n=1 Tax=Pecten maximus TaxID=6579 RepID=UPI0014588A1C|nr:vacuolar protein sorting-associated protein 13A-like isoform X3 [Pecten maximus]
MVFESLVVDLINKYLGDYVENLDRSQLKLGIWGGDAVLQNLDLKESALDDLDLPVKIKAGHIGKLTLKIPWKNLYTEPVIASIDGVYALAVPNIAIKYNAEKEEKAKQEAKQRRLQQIEEAKQLEAEKNKPKDPKKDSFAEKMATQIIKNLQVHVKNIHVRYEDSYTNPKRPFSLGVTLQELLFQTTDENWTPCILKEAVTQIYKLVRLDSLAVYWNSSSECLDGTDKAAILERLKTDIASKDKKTQSQYLIKPISLVSHLRLNTKPEQTKFTIPKIYLTLVFDDIAVMLSKMQYTDILEMLEALERMTLRGVYRKYRPEVAVHQHSKKWWHFAMTSVLEESVRRRRRMWSWDYISKHRKSMRDYREAYVKKLDSKKVPGDVQKKIEECERVLDVFSLTLMRQQAEVEAAKLGAKREKEKEEKGWFGGLFGGKKKKESQASKEGGDIQEKFQELYTPEEKAKLYNAIGYEENESDPTLPKEFVAVKFVTKLTTLSFTLKDDSKRDPQILRLQLKDVFSSFGQRPAASAIQLEAKIDRFTVSGVQQNGQTPRMVLSQTEEEDQVYSLLDVQVETNPLDGACDTRVRLNARPLQIVYDAVTVNQLAEFFKPPEEIRLQQINLQLSQVAVAKFEDFKEQSATGLQHAIDMRKYTDIRIDVKSSYVIVPEGGFYKKNCKQLILDLGNLKVNSEKNQSSSGVKGQHGSKFRAAALKAGQSQPTRRLMDTVEEIIQRAYDKFNIEIDRTQLLFVNPGDDWQAVRTLPVSPLHVLEPISLSVCLQKCMFDKDSRMAKMKVSGELKLVSLTMSDARLQEIIQLVDSIPLPESAPPLEEEDIFMSATDIQVTDLNANQLSLADVAVVAVGDKPGDPKDMDRSTSQDLTNYTDLELKFEVKKVCVNLMQHTNTEDILVLKLVIESIGTQLAVRTHDMGAEAYIGGIYLQYLKEKASETLVQKLEAAKATHTLSVTNGGPLINLINTPSVDDHMYRLLTVHYVKANPDGPDFATTHKKTEQTVTVTFTALEVMLHQEALLSLIVFAEGLQPPPRPQVEIKASTTSERKEESTDKKDRQKSGTKKKGKEKDPDQIDIKVNAHLDQIGVTICTKQNLITDLRVRGIDAKVTIQEEMTVVSAMLKAITIFDPDPDTLYQKIMEIQGEAVLALDITIYNHATEGAKYADMSCMDTSVNVTLGCIRLVFVNKFVNDLLVFVNNFQAAKDQAVFQAARERMVQAGQSVAEFSKDAVSKLQEKAPRVGLKINMHAPLIVIPLSSKSREVLLADFGELSIQNSFHLTGKSSSSGVPAVLDRMIIQLKQLKLTRAVFTIAGASRGECLILEPVTITLNVTRNLSISWYTDQPEVDITGSMEAIVATMSQGDFKMAMALLDENLNEGQTNKEVAVQGQAEVEQPTESPLTGSQESPSGISSESQVTPKTSGSTEVKVNYTKVKFNFQMKSLEAALYIGESNLDSGTSSRDPAKCLGKVELKVIAVDGKVMLDGAIVTKVILKDTVVDDARPEKQKGVTRMIERNVDSGEKMIGTGGGQGSNMIDVSFTQESSQDKDIAVKVSSLYICVCVDFLMALATFFQMPESKSKPAVTAKEEKPKATPSKQVQEAPVAEMRITVTMEKPEIILIEDQSKPSSTALKMDTHLSFKMRMSAERQEMSATVRDLQIISCVFDQRQNVGSQILHPCEISFYSQAPFGKGAHMDLSTTDLILNISPATIRTISAVVDTLSAKSGEAEKASAYQVPSDLWEVKKLEGNNFWYLTTGETDPVIRDLSNLEEEDQREEQSNSESLIVKVPTIVVKIEGGVGNRTVPLLILESSFQGEVKDWSGKLGVESTLKLEVAYYNEKLTVWEPLVEPIMEDGKLRRWELGLEVTMNEDLPVIGDDEVDGESENIVLPPPKMSVNIRSNDALQLVMSKTCLEVLNNLGKSFGEAYQLVEPTEKAGVVMSPYVIKNNTGIPMVMKLDNSFEMPDDASNMKVKLSPTRQLHLFTRKKSVLSRKASVIKATQEGDEKKLIFQMEQYNATREVTIKRAEKRLYQINNRTSANEVWAVVVCTDSHIGQRVVSLRSIVQVKNHLPQTVEVYYREGSKISSCGLVLAEETMDVPLHTIYTDTGEFFFKPVSETDEYRVSKESVGWRSAANLGTKQLTCEGQQGHSPFFMNVWAECEQIYYEEGDSMTAKSYTLHLCPTVIFHNLLPFPIKFMLEGTEGYQTLDRGENLPLTNAGVGKSNLEIVIPNYMDKEWCGRNLLRVDIPDLSLWSFSSFIGAQKVEMDLGFHCKKGSGSMDLSLYSPYWMINKTGQRVLYKASDSEDVIEHHHDHQEAVLFSFKQKSFFTAKKKKNKHTVKSALAEPAFVVSSTLTPEEDCRMGMEWQEGKDHGKDKKVKEWRQSGKACLKIGDTEWSDKFSLDVVGSSGTVQCKTKMRTFEVGVNIVLSQSGLTKICTFTPYYMLLNTADHSLLVAETTPTETWYEIKSKECQPFWPQNTAKEMKMKAKVLGSESVTSEFLFNKAHNTLARLNDQYGGINVDCQVTESAMVTTFSSYKDGMATVQIVNHTEAASVTFHQSGSKNTQLLGPGHYMMYTWENTTDKREIVWTCGEKKDVKNTLVEDGYGWFALSSDTNIYWVSFLDGMQRVLLFTEDLQLATLAQQAGELERIEQEINVCVQGLGLSLINDVSQTEVAFLGITSSGIIWEEKKKRYKALSVKNGLVLEEAYQKYLMELDLGHSPPAHLNLENKMEVDFVEMKMIRPNKRGIRRSFQEGIWVQYKTSPHQIQVHAKINRLQLDNQMTGAVFPTVLSPVPLPKSVAADSVPKPFTEVSIMLRKHEHDSMLQFKYFKVLVQEMQLKVDQGFLNNIIDLFSSNQDVSREQETTEFIKDCDKVQVKLMDEVGLSLADEQKNFYDYLHFSPIKIHLSFSLQGGGGDGKPTQIHANVINIFLQSVGVVLTDVQDVVFKLGFFQKEHCFYNQSQLVGQMSMHYAGQAIKQMYVLVLGLDVLGNPFGLLRGMAEGIEDLFYEPYQGAIQGPEEFAEGLALGVRSLFGHAVGGAAGAVSRITGTLGKGFAALTLDDDYQKKRREAMNKRPANVREGLARGGKGLVMGVFDGVTGIVRKPIEGAKNEGVGGFFKGVGKGLVGVVTRPTSGVIDFASSSLEGIKRITDFSEEIRRIRPPRRFHSDRVIRPYNKQEAEGYAILSETEKGKFATTDHYVAHLVLSRDSKHVLVVTDKRVIFANRGELFGHWDADWTYTWVEMKEPPKRSQKGIEIYLKEKEKKKFLFSSSTAKKEVAIGDQRLAEWIANKIKETMMRGK